MAGSSFMTGLINGFMSFGGAGAMSGGAGAAGSSASAAGTSGAAAAGASGSTGSLPTSSIPTGSGSPSGAAPGSSGMPTSGGGEKIGTTSQALSTGGSSSGSGDIIRENPYGTGSSGTSSAAGDAKQQKLGKDLMDVGKGISDNAAANHGNMPTGGTYGALFGNSQFGGSPMSGGGATMAVPNMTPAMAAPALAQRPQMPMMSGGTPLPAPMSLPMVQPQMTAPVPPALTVSDRNAKYNVMRAHPETEAFLKSVYDSVISKRNK